MDSKIQALSDKVYQEGVLKGQAEAERIIAEATARAEAREAAAERRAAEILQGAERAVEVLKQNTERELQLYAGQLVEATRASVTAELTGRIATENVEALSANPEFIQQFMLELVRGFDLSRGVEIAGADAERLSEYIARHARHLLDEGLSIKTVAGKPSQFVLRPADGGYKLQIGEAEFLELFKSFVRPQLQEQLF